MNRSASDICWRKTTLALVWYALTAITFAADAGVIAGLLSFNT